MDPARLGAVKGPEKTKRVARRRHNTQTRRDRQKLVEDFERRVRHSREEGDLCHLLQRPRSLAWVVHPLADEADLLAKLGLEPGSCWKADAYWRYGESVYFVEFFSSTPPTIFRDGKPIGQAPSYSRLPGIYDRFDKDLRQDIFDIFLPRSVVASADLHHGFQLLEEIIDSGRIEADRSNLEDRAGRWIGGVGRIAELT